MSHEWLRKIVMTRIFGRTLAQEVPAAKGTCLLEGDGGRPLARIRLANAAAQLVLRTQARRKEQGPPSHASPASPLEEGYFPRKEREPGDLEVVCGHNGVTILLGAKHTLRGLKCTCLNSKGGICTSIRLFRTCHAQQ